MKKFKQLILRYIYGRRWPSSRRLEEGYAILLPTPMDLPFLLRFALEGLRQINTANCKQIVVVPDAWGTDGGEALRRVVAEFDDPRIAIAAPRPIDYRIVRLLNNSANTHWLACVNGTAHTRCEYAFLHDADAFFVDPDGPERQYRECRDRDMYSLGVTARNDAFFTQIGYENIAATWELMYSVAWALRHGSFAFKGGMRMTPRGDCEFDSMLLPQFLDYPSGKIGVMESPPEIIHFFGVIGAFRLYEERRRKPTGRPIVDQRLRLLLVALLEDIFPDPSGHRAMPTVEELSRGLTDSTAPVMYTSVEAAHEYSSFRERIEALCHVPAFQGPRADQLRKQLKPFDAYYLGRSAEADPLAKSEPHYVRYAIG
jgi:hypothetical protein